MLARDSANSSDDEYVCPFTSSHAAAKPRSAHMDDFVQVLNLGPEDIILFRATQPISRETAERLKANLREQFGHQRVVVIGPELEVSVLKSEGE